MAHKWHGAEANVHLGEIGLRFDGTLDLDRDSQLNSQRQQLAVVGGERGRRPRRARALQVDGVVARLRQLLRTTV